MKLAEIRLLSAEEIRAKLNDAQQEYMNLRFQAVSGQLTDTSRLKQNRRLIATYMTILGEKERAGEEGA
jgi:large subunit ribosomal protein L29